MGDWRRMTKNDGEWLDGKSGKLFTLNAHNLTLHVLYHIYIKIHVANAGAVRKGNVTLRITIHHMGNHWYLCYSQNVSPHKHTYHNTLRRDHMLNMEIDRNIQAENGERIAHDETEMRVICSMTSICYHIWQFMNVSLKHTFHIIKLIYLYIFHFYLLLLYFVKFY